MPAHVARNLRHIVERHHIVVRNFEYTRQRLGFFARPSEVYLVDITLLDISIKHVQRADVRSRQLAFGLFVIYKAHDAKTVSGITVHFVVQAVRRGIGADYDHSHKITSLATHMLEHKA